MSIFVVAVPALLVVVLGYTVWEAVGAPGSPEPAGWTTGLMLLVVMTRLLLSRPRRLRRALRRARARGNDAEVARLQGELARPRRSGGRRRAALSGAGDLTPEGPEAGFPAHETTWMKAA